MPTCNISKLPPPKEDDATVSKKWWGLVGLGHLHVRVMLEEVYISTFPQEMCQIINFPDDGEVWKRKNG